MINLIINGTTYQYPEVGDRRWGAGASNWASAVTTGMLQKAGGLFTLLAEVDFGATYGLKSVYFKSRASVPSSTGIVRLGNTENVSWRDFGNTGDLALSVNASNQLTFNGSAIISSGGPPTGIAAGNLAGTYPNPTFAAAMTVAAALGNVSLKQSNSTNGTVGSSFTIQAQNDTGTTSLGGDLILTSGTGTTAAGNSNLQTGGVTKVSIQPTFVTFNGTGSTEALRITPDATGDTIIQFATGVSDATIKIADQSSGTTGSDLTIRAQNDTGTTSVGGDTHISSGTGTTRDGYVILETGDTAKVTIAQGLVTIATGVNLFLPEQDQSVAPDVGAGQGCYWVRNNAPSEPLFTTDTDKIVKIQNALGVITSQTSVTNNITSVVLTGAYVELADHMVVGTTYEFNYVYKFTRGGTAAALTVTNSFNIGTGTDMTLNHGTPTAAGDYVVIVKGGFTMTAVGSSGTYMGWMSATGTGVNETDGMVMNTFDGSLNTTVNQTFNGFAGMDASIPNCTITSYNGNIKPIA